MAALDLGDLGFKITVETGEFDRAMSRVEQAAKKVDKQLDTTGKKKLSVKADGGQLDKLESSAKEAASALDQVGGKRVSPKVEAGGLGQVKTAAADAAGELSELNSHADKSASAFAGAAGSLAKFAGAAVGLGSIASAAQAVASAGMDFQSQMNTLSAVSGATGDQLAAVGARARELGTDASLTATSASDAAAAMTELAKGGFTVEQSMTAAKGTLQLAAAAQVEAAEAATIQSQALQAFSLGAEDAGRIADILAGAANASSAEMTGIAQGLQQAGTVANQFGLSIDDTATSLAMLANAGIQGSDAGTLLKSAMLALTDQGKPAQQAIEELGLTVYDANGKFVGMSSLLGQLKDASASMTDEQYQAATAVLFGSDAMRLAGVAAVQGSEGFDTLKEAVTRQGQAAEVAAAQTQGLPGVWERVQNTMEDLSLGVFDQVDEQLVRMGNGAVDALDAAAPKIEAFASGVSGLAGATMDGVGKTIDMWGKLPSPVQDAAKAFAALKVAQAALNTEMGKGAVGKVSAFTNAIKNTGRGVADLKEYYRSTGREISTFTAATQLAATSSNRTLSGMATAFNDSAQSGRKFGRSLGVAKAGMVGLKSAAGGLVGALGGPWGVAFMAAATAVTSIVSASQKAKAVQDAYSEATREAAAAQAELNTSLAGTGTALSSAQLENVTKVVEAQTVGMKKMAEEFSGSFNVVEAPDLSWWQQGHWSSEWREYANEVNNAKDAYAAIEKAAGDLNIPMSDLNRVVAEGGPQFDSLMQSLRNGGDDSQVAAQKLQGIRDSIEESIEAARQLDPAAAQAAAGIDILADASSSAEDKLSALKSVMQSMGLMAQTAMEANMEAAEKIDEVASKMGELGGAEGGVGSALFDGDELDYTNQNAQALSDTLGSLSDQLMNVAVANGDVAGVWDLMGPQLEQLRAQMGLTGEEFDAQWQQILESYGLVPDVVTTLVELEGASEAVQSLGDVWAALYPLEEGAKVNIEPPEPAVLDAMDELGIKYEAIKNDAGEVIQYKVTAPTDEVMGQLNDITAKMADIDDETVKIETIMDTTPLKVGVENAQALIDQLKLEDVSPRAQLIIDDLLANGNIAKGDLEYLNQMSANPVANLEKTLLDAGVKDAHDQLQGVDDHDTLSKMEGDATGVRNEANSARNAINQVPNEKSTTFTARLAGAWDAVRNFFGGGGGGGSRSGRFYAGGRIPGYADGGNPGYKLPGTGPGTHMTDGFLGVTAAGMPLARLDADEWVINSRSANKFDRTLAGINAGDKRAILAGLAKELPGLADGGRTKSDEVISQLSGFNNGPYVMGGFSPSSFDCSGAVAATVNTWLGLDPFDSRMSTVNEGAWLAAKGFKSGRGNGNELVVGWYDYGGGANGHTALMLPDGTFIESGGNTGQGFTIGGAAGPLDGRGFTNFMYLPGSGDDKPGGELTGDLGETDGYGTTLGGPGSRTKASWSAVSAPTPGKGFHAPGLASNRVNGTVGGSLSGAHKAEVRKYADQYGVPQGMVDQAFAFANPFLGNHTFREEIGEPGTKQILSIAKQLEDAIGRGGIASQVEAALNATTPNWDVWLRVNEDTLAAFNELGEAETNRKNASMDITEAEEKLAELRKNAAKADEKSTEKLTEAYKNLEKAKNKKLTKTYTEAKRAEDVEKAEKKIRDIKNKSTEEDVKSAQRIAEAEQDLIEAREAEQRAVEEVRQAQLIYNAALTVAPIKAVASLADNLADGMARVADTMGLMAENMDKANRVADQRLDAELADIQAKRGAVDAAQALRDLERQNQQARHDDVLAQQQAEYELAVARAEHAEAAGNNEVNLANLRNQGILDVAQKATDADRVAILSASNVEVAEMNLDAIRAASAEAEFDRKIAVEQATDDLNYAQAIGKLAAESLEAATVQLANSAARAADVLGNSASALMQEQQGKQKQAKGSAGIIGGIAQLGMAAAMTIGTGGAALPAAIGLGVGGLGSIMKGATSIAEGRAQEKAYKKQARKEYDALSKDDRRRVDASRGGLVAGTIAGGLVGAAGGSAEDVAGMFDATSGLLNLPLYKKQMEKKYGLEAAEMMAAKAEADINRRRKKLEIDKARRDLGRVERVNPRKNELADITQSLQQQLAELKQENSQLAGVNTRLDTNNSLLDDKNKSVLMTIGGSGWGQDLEAGMRMAASAGGFGGVTRDEVGEWSSLNVEGGWRNLNKVRAMVEKPLLSVADTAADAAAAASKRTVIEGLPETVVGGRYARQLADGVVEGAQRAAQRSAEAGAEATRRRAYEDAAQAVLTQMGGTGDTTNVGTQFTGAVTVNAKLEDKVLNGLSSMVKNR